MLNDTRNSNGTRDHATNSALDRRSVIIIISIIAIIMSLGGPLSSYLYNRAPESPSHWRRDLYRQSPAVEIFNSSHFLRDLIRLRSAAGFSLIDVIYHTTYARVQSIVKGGADACRCVQCGSPFQR